MVVVRGGEGVGVFILPYNLINFSPELNLTSLTASLMFFVERNDVSDLNGD